MLLLTLVLVLLRFSGPWPLRIAVTALAVSGLVRPRWQSSSWLWLAFAALLGVRLVVDWPLPDNHVYLLAYWCLALGLTRLAERPDEACAQAARLLIAGCFGFAVLWKAWLSPDFVEELPRRRVARRARQQTGKVQSHQHALEIRGLARGVILDAPRPRVALGCRQPIEARLLGSRGKQLRLLCAPRRSSIEQRVMDVGGEIAVEDEVLRCQDDRRW